MDSLSLNISNASNAKKNILPFPPVRTSAPVNKGVKEGVRGGRRGGEGREGRGRKKQERKDSS